MKRCKKHSKYKALRKPTAKCVTCCEMYLEQCRREVSRLRVPLDRASRKADEAFAIVSRARDSVNHDLNLRAAATEPWDYPDAANYGLWE